MIKQSRMQVFYRVLPILIVIIALTARFLPGTRTIDDAYITYRYSQNILEGHGLVYNPGERVLGTTTPLYAGLWRCRVSFSAELERLFQEFHSS